MKRVLVLLIVLFFLSCFCVFAQTPTAVFDAAVSGILTYTGAEQFIYYGQQVAHNVESLIQTVATVKNLEQQIKMAAQNMRSISDVRSWDDFMGWYNRQLYLERRAKEIYQGMNVQIGSKSYHITDIKGIAEGSVSQSKEYWESEFTEAQRKSMWLEMGLTPSNYAYVKPYREKAMQIAVEGLAAREMQNEWYMRVMQRSNERQKRRADDKNKEEDKKMGQKEVLMDIAESIDELNKVTNDIAMQNAQMLEMQAVKHFTDQAKADPAPIAAWKEDGFKPLTDYGDE